MQEFSEANSTVVSQKESFRQNRPARAMLMLLAALIISIISIAPYFFSHYEENHYRLIKSHDISNHYVAMEQFEKTFRSGALYPRWYSDANRGYGIATPNYYPPGFYYCTTLINAIFNNWHTTLLVIMALVFAGSAVALYFLARAFFGRGPSAIAAVVYLLLPYHQLELYWRGAFAELIGFIFIPLTLYFAFKAGTAGRIRDRAGLGFFYGLHLLTHFPVGLMFTYLFAFYVFVWAAKERDFKIALRIGAGMLLGLMVSAVYWLPAAIETKDTLEYQTQIYPYHTAYISPLPTTDPFFSIIEKTLKLNALLLFAAIAVLRAKPKMREKLQPLPEDSEPASESETRRQRQVWLWIICCGASLFMTTAFSYDISVLLPKIEITVPPFRWLAISSVFISLLVAACADRLMKSEELTRSRLWAYRGLMVAILALNLFFCVRVVIITALANPTFEPVQDYLEHGFTPNGSTLPENLPDTPLIVVEPLASFSEVVRWEPQSREVRVKVDAPSKVRIKTFNFPGWTARIDGEKTAISSDEDSVQLIDVPPGLHTIEVDFENTPSRTLGASFTIIGFLAVFGLSIADQLRRRRRHTESRQSLTQTASIDRDPKPPFNG